MTPTQLSALSQIAAAAVASERTTRLPAELSVAQCCLESGYLAHCPGCNPWGIKKARRHDDAQELMTTEVIHRDDMQPGDAIVAELPDGRVKIRGKRWFARFETLEDAFVDHAWLVTTGAPYRKAWAQFQADGDVPALVRGVAAKYATDPAYADKLLRIISMPEVREAIAVARAQTPETVKA